jgi:hypothetical protein
VCPLWQIPSHPLMRHYLLRPTARAPWQGEEAIFAHAVSRRGTCALPGRHLLRWPALGVALEALTLVEKVVKGRNVDTS